MSKRSSSDFVRHARTAFRRGLPLTSLLIAVACEPVQCQGRIDGLVKQTEDVPNIVPRCAGGNTTVDADVDIVNQAQLDTLTGCVTIEGNVFIHDSTDIVNLDALASLQAVRNGYILLLNNAALTNANLGALQQVNTGLAAIDNPELVTADFPALTTLQGDLTMRANPKQTSIKIPNVEILDNAEVIIDNVPKVVAFGNLILGDLPSLTSVQGSFDTLLEIEGSLEVYNTGLVNFAGMEQLERILNTGGAAQQRTINRVDKLNPGLLIGIDFDSDFNVVPAGNPAFVDFTGLDNLAQIGGDLFIGFNPAFRNFNKLDDLETITGNVFIVENATLENFQGLEGDNEDDDQNDGFSVINGNLFVGLFFDRFGKPIAGGNDGLTNLQGLESLTTITGDMVFAFNTSMETLEGLDLFTTLGGDLTFLGQNMDDLKGALLLTTIGGDLNFGQLFNINGKPFDPEEDERDEDKLTDVFDKATAISTGVTLNPNAGQNGFDALTTVNGNLIVAFSNIDDLQFSDPDGDPNDPDIGPANLTTVNGTLFLYGNDAPDALTGIDTLNTLGGLSINFAKDVFGDLVPFENNGFNDFTALDVDLGAGGLAIGFDDDIDDAGFATLRNFGTIAGDVILASVDDEDNRGPTDLNELNVTNIGGDLVVCAIKNDNDAPVRGNLDQLTALNINATNAVAGDVLIAFCTDLVDTTMSIANVGGSFELTGLEAVEVIDGLNGLTNAGEVLVHDNPDVTDINLVGLANVAGNMQILDNPNLVGTDFNLANVGGTLRIVNLPSLIDLDGFNTLDTVGGDLDIIDCPAIENTLGMNDLNTVGGTLRIRRLTTITNEAQADGEQDLTFNQLTAVGSLEVTEMENIEDLAGLNTLVEVGIVGGVASGGGALTIVNNPRLETLFGLQGITTIRRKISVVNNPLLSRFAFDDDDQNRELDEDVGDVDNSDDDNESGIVNLRTLGEGLDEDGAAGATGVVEFRDNPNIRQVTAEDPDRNGQDDPGILQQLVALLVGYEGLVLLCGNEDSVIDDDATDRIFLFETCGAAQDGVIDLFNGAGGDVGEGEGEGEGE
jgi:hypothetical protein